MPQAAPTIALSLMGVSITRSQPKRSSSPSLVLNAPPYTPTSSPSSTTAGSRSISSNRAWRIASRKVIWVAFDSGAFAWVMIYLRAFRDAAATTALAIFLAGDFPFGASLRSGPAAARWGWVSPKWIGDALPLVLFPAPKPGTVHTAATLDFGGVTSAMGRSHLGRILWQSSPVQ